MPTLRAVSFSFWWLLASPGSRKPDCSLGLCPEVAFTPCLGVTPRPFSYKHTSHWVQDLPPRNPE